MAWGTKYRGTFYSEDGNNYRLDIMQDAYSGTINTLTLADNPIYLHYTNDSDDIYSPIISSTLDINCISYTDYELYNLANCTQNQYLVILYKNSAVFWQGFLMPLQYEEDYKAQEQGLIVRLKARDGLNLLKTKYPSTSGIWGTTSYDTSWQTVLLSRLIFDGIKAIGYNEKTPTNFLISCRLFEDTHTINNTTNLFVQTYAQKRFYADDLNNPLDYYTILERIMEAFQCRLFQYNGSYNIVRIPDLKSSTSIVTQIYAYYSSDYNYVSNSTIDYSLLVSATTKILNGKISIVPGAQKVVLNRQYGRTNSMAGGGMNSKDWASTSTNYFWTTTGSGLIWAQGSGFAGLKWTTIYYKAIKNSSRRRAADSGLRASDFYYGSERVPYIGSAPQVIRSGSISGVMNAEIFNSNGMTIYYNASNYDIGHDAFYLSQGCYYKLTIKAKAHNSATKFYYWLKSGSYYLTSTGSWTTSLTYIPVNLSGEDQVTTYELTFYNTYKTSVNFYLRSPDAGDVFISEIYLENLTYSFDTINTEYSAMTDAIQESVNYNITLLDGYFVDNSDKYAFRNCLYLSSGSPTNTWNSGSKLHNLMGADLAAQYGINRPFFSGTIYSTSFIHPGIVLGASGVELYSNHKFFPVNISFNVQQNEYDVDLNSIVTW